MLRRIPAVLLTILISLPAFAAARITYDIKGVPTPIGWAPTAFPLRYEIDSRLAALGPSIAATVERAFAAWQRVEDARVRFESKGIVEGANARADDRLVVGVAEGLLRDQGAVALTTYTWDTESGRMLDADISIDPSLFDGRVDAQLALVHEVGHLLGLDHSAVLSSVMYPYVGPPGGGSDLDSDDLLAIASVYPRADPALRGATLQGRVYGDSGAIFGAQVVAVNEHGHAVGTALTDANGDFALTGVPPGQYRMYAEPLDGPVSAHALQGVWRLADPTPFPTRFFGPPLTVESGRVYGNLVVTTGGAVELNPRLIGVSPANGAEISLSTTPVYVSAGQTLKLTVGGDGFVSGMTEFEVLDPAFQRISEFSWWDSAVSAVFRIDPSASKASSIVLVRSGRETATLTGALRLRGAERVRAVRK